MNQTFLKRVFCGTGAAKIELCGSGKRYLGSKKVLIIQNIFYKIFKKFFLHRYFFSQYKILDQFWVWILFFHSNWFLSKNLIGDVILNICYILNNYGPNLIINSSFCCTLTNRFSYHQKHITKRMQNYVISILKL